MTEYLWYGAAMLVGHAAARLDCRHRTLACLCVVTAAGISTAIWLLVR